MGSDEVQGLTVRVRNGRTLGAVVGVFGFVGALIALISMWLVRAHSNTTVLTHTIDVPDQCDSTICCELVHQSMQPLNDPTLRQRHMEGAGATIRRTFRSVTTGLSGHIHVQPAMRGGEIRLLAPSIHAHISPHAASLP
jgi:hypothetical protein